MHVCEKVTLFGFAGSSIKDWYFPKRPGGKALPKNKWMREKRWTIDTWKFGVDGKGTGGGGGGGGDGGEGGGGGGATAGAGGADAAARMFQRLAYA